MDYSKALLRQSEELLNLDSGRRKQVNLRRAVSNAYYALFHKLTWETSSYLIRGNTALRLRVQRSFQHTEMKRACLPFRNGALYGPIGDLIEGPPLPDLILIATVFTDLQDRRHIADYDMSAHFDLVGVTQDVRDAGKAVAAVGGLRNASQGGIFFASLAFGARWSK